MQKLSSQKIYILIQAAFKIPSLYLVPIYALQTWVINFLILGFLMKKDLVSITDRDYREQMLK